jgi:Protein of unknown function (DUF1207)
MSLTFSAAHTRVAVCLLLLGTMAFGTRAEAQPAEGVQRPLTWTHSSGTTFRLFPSGDVYPVYVADPHRPMNAITVMFYSQVRIEDTDTPRTGLNAGGRFGILRIDPSRPGGRSWQVSINAGLDAVFDSQHKLDAIGWDGNYGLTVTTATGGPFAFKAGVLHQSSHLGDEYAARTGRERINYTREEVALGVSWRIRPRLRAYGETGVQYIGRSDSQEPWRVQTGLEYESRPKLWGGRFSWYAAGDFSSMQERDWRLDNALQTGIVTRSDGRTYRLGVGWTDGRPPIGEFNFYTEQWLTVGFWIDL